MQKFPINIEERKRLEIPATVRKGEKERGKRGRKKEGREGGGAGRGVGREKGKEGRKGDWEKASQEG